MGGGEGLLLYCFVCTVHVCELKKRYIDLFIFVFLVYLYVKVHVWRYDNFYGMKLVLINCLLVIGKGYTEDEQGNVGPKEYLAMNKRFVDIKGLCVVDVDPK